MPAEATPSVTAQGAGPAFYRWVWHWHFYAGLFVLPFILILSVTGSIYLFKPQVERWEERAFLDLGTDGAVSPERQVAAALAANPGMRFNHYRLPRAAGDAAMIQLLRGDGKPREIYVSPQGAVLGSLDPGARIEAVVSRIHGSLLIGTIGDRLVELAASWTIVLILSGLYLWWPRPFALAGTVWPRLRLRGRPLLKDLHRVTGFWIAGLVLVMLASGLPWAGAWGGAAKWVRSEFGLVKGQQDWKIGAGGGHAGHHGAMAGMPMPPMGTPAGLPLSVFVAKAAAEHMAFPVLVLPPHAQQKFGPPTGTVWTIKSEAQNRWLDRRVTYDPATGAETGRSGFADQHVLDRIVNTGVAWHEGQLFGVANQLIGVATAAGLVAISVLGVLLWLKRRPRGTFGAPAVVARKASRGLIVLLVGLALLLPLFGLSLIGIAMIDRLVALWRSTGRVRTA
jgi:uncharacterized iron-regulated membrane protein